MFLFEFALCELLYGQVKNSVQLLTISSMRYYLENVCWKHFGYICMKHMPFYYQLRIGKNVGKTKLHIYSYSYVYIDKWRIQSYIYKPCTIQWLLWWQQLATTE